MNKEFRDWLEEKKRVSAYSYLNNGKLIIPNPDIENELEIVIKKYDELHKPAVIPQYVDEWIIRHRDIFDLYPALRRLESNSLTWNQIYKWYRENTHEFVNAYLTGEYEVEEEPLYYAKLKDVHPLKKEWLVNLTTPKYYVVNTRGLMFGEFTLDLVGVKTNASAYNLEDWGSYGINDDIVDFVRAEEER